MKEIYYKKDLSKLDSFKENVRKYVASKDYELQEQEGNQLEWVCQIKKESKWTLGIGSKALTIVIEDFSDNLIKVKIGEGKWLSKISGGLITTVVSGPLFLLAAPTTVLGVIGQVKLTSEIVSLADLNLK
ncbi:hypothetical protein SAMN04488700_0632 [Carnobacterium iners]|uniref:Uncharacterized protein n=1 Tax=Carnobacterium iners TaxID=1073423 RepID=A0A1X7MRB8_9LACT|nr:hypothetical protein [Carnobacterium iners]SEL39307.1 hypothetical protein SAMN04488114_1741 [Carnobacterium iners]SMH27370.1 hypothetical protein SAMN04488700_0632 [Carnobacterium iners]